MIFWYVKSWENLASRAYKFAPSSVSCSHFTLGNHISHFQFCIFHNAMQWHFSDVVGKFTVMVIVLFYSEIMQIIGITY